MRLLLSCLFLLFLFGSRLPAQSYTISPAPSVFINAPLDIYSEEYIYLLVDDPTDTLRLRWRLIEDQLPVGWTVNLCDYNLCYVGVPSSGTMAPVSGFDVGYLKLLVNPYQVLGSGFINFYVFEIRQPQQGDTLTFYVESMPLGIGQVPQQQFAVELFPNPAQQEISLLTTEGVITHWTLTDVIGRSLPTPAAEWRGSSLVLSVQDLPRGSYNLLLTNEEGKRSAKRLLKL